MAEYTLVLRSEEQSAKFGRRRLRQKNLKTYEVLDAAGVSLGFVREQLVTMERRIAGRRWVEERWEAPRWRCRGVGDVDYHRVNYETRQLAVDALVRRT